MKIEQKDSRKKNSKLQQFINSLPPVKVRTRGVISPNAQFPNHSSGDGRYYIPYVVSLPAYVVSVVKKLRA